MKKMFETLSVITALGLAAGCTSTKQAPRELSDARNAFTRARTGPGADLAQAQLHTAQQALEKAEKEYAENEKAPEARDLAYIAERKAQLAESEANAELARQQVALAEKVVQEEELASGKRAKAELAKTREDLAQAQFAARDAITKLSGLENSVKEDDRGMVITLSGNVLFELGKAQLLPAAQTQLDAIAQALVGAKSESVRIEGFTDASGSSARNKALSGARAKAVLDYLASKGVPSDSMESVGRGPSNPVATNDSVEGRASNRRVELIVQGQAAAKR